MSGIAILGGTGFVGTNLVEYFKTRGLTTTIASRRTGVDAANYQQLCTWLQDTKPDVLVNLAAECGGIGLNQRTPATLWHSSQIIAANVMEATRVCEVSKLINLGTVCFYAKHCPTPFRESDIMCHGLPEETNLAYAIAKLSSVYGARAYSLQYDMDVHNLVTVNMYGPHDHFDFESSHVIPAMIAKMALAKRQGTNVELWGTGQASREFLYAGDCCRAIECCLDRRGSGEPLNIGNGREIKIADLATLIASRVGFTGQIIWDYNRPDGQPRRCLDVSLAARTIGFRATTTLEQGLDMTVEWFLAQTAGSGS